MALKTIILKGEGTSIEKAAAAATIYPGYLCELNSSDQLAIHSTSGGTQSSIVAIEDELQGKEISQNYASGDIVLARVLRPGDVALMVVADGQNISIGEYVDSNGDGTLKSLEPASAGVSEFPRSCVGVALSAVDASDSATTTLANRRIQIMIL